jgi:hypothetical protein
MATRATKAAASVEDRLSPLPPEGPELDAPIKAKVDEALADPRPYVPIEEAIARVHARIDAAR